MRVEWAKSKARADRWDEEILLLTEEMRRVIEYLEWQAQWWIIQGSRRRDTHLTIQEGVVAYAAKHAAMCRQMAMSFALRWYPDLHANGITVEWPVSYIPTSPLSSDADMVDGTH